MRNVVQLRSQSGHRPVGAAQIDLAGAGRTVLRFALGAPERKHLGRVEADDLLAGCRKQPFQGGIGVDDHPVAVAEHRDRLTDQAQQRLGQPCCEAYVLDVRCGQRSTTSCHPTSYLRPCGFKFAALRERPSAPTEKSFPKSTNPTPFLCLLERSERPAANPRSSRGAQAAEYRGMELTYRALDLFAGTPGWNSGATRTVGWRLWLAAAAGMLSAAWMRSGPVVALATLGLMVALGAVLYGRLRRLRIVADEREVVAVNWLRTHRWRWEDIDS